MARIIIGEYKPDLDDNLSASTRTIKNVLPREDGYGPFKDMVAFTQALPGACRGYTYSRNPDGSVSIFAGTANRLYKLDNTNFTWADVSLGGSAYTGLPSTDQWQFAQFNNLLFATQINSALQVFNLSSPSTFVNALGTPPQAKYITIVGRFLVISGISGQAYRVQWSGLNNVNASTSWDNVTLQSNFQDLADGGLVRGVAGGEYGLITQDAALRRMTYAPGNPVIFQIDRISEEKGIYAPLSLTRSGDRIFWVGVDGLKMIVPGGYPQPIGKNKLDDTFFADIDPNNLQLCIGSSDPAGTRWFLAYRSKGGQGLLFDKMICYDWALQKFSPIVMSGEYIATLAQPGLTLEGLDAIAPGGSIDALSFSLDSISASAFAQISGFNSSHALGFFSGPNLEGIVETAEEGVDGQRIKVKSFAPITDASVVYGSISYRDNLQATATYGSETKINAVGKCPQRRDTRYARMRSRIPYGTVWSYIEAVVPEFGSAGKR